jgi:hypothetical protein
LADLRWRNLCAAPVCDVLDYAALERVFIAAGHAGANHDTAHPLRALWLAARDVLRAAGRVK